ncbi:MAG: cytochrome c3 family protein [Anaerolineae bacterium]|jgi:hypothetical protein
MKRKQKRLLGRDWPHWIVIPFGIGLAGFVVVLGLLVEPVGYALSPSPAPPTPTLPVVEYGRDISEGCHDCHFSLPPLEASANDPTIAGEYLIEPESVQTKHGSLGCVACHRGDGEAEDKEMAHAGLVLDITEEEPQMCVICHHDLPEKIGEDELLIPHELVEYKISHGEESTLFCSDCHGRVGHGFDPVSGKVACTMMVCVDCHTEQGSCRGCHQASEPGVEMTGCDVCHQGPHDVTDYLTCSCCHISMESWSEIDASSHPVELEGAHGELHCFQCHSFPDFKGLHYVCADCHQSGHPGWGGEDCIECHDPAATWNDVNAEWDQHVEIWDMYRGDHRDVACRGCHFEDFAELDPSCDSCHSLPESHDATYTECWICH